MGLEERNDAGACHFPATRCLYLPLPSTIRLITRYVLAPLILSRTTFRLYELALKSTIIILLKFLYRDFGDADIFINL